MQNCIKSATFRLLQFLKLILFLKTWEEDKEIENNLALQRNCCSVLDVVTSKGEKKIKRKKTTAWLIKKNESLPFATAWVDLEGIMLGEISQTEKDKYCIISLICGI